MLTALMTTAAFGAGTLGFTAAANRVELDWEAVSAFGGAAGSVEATANFGVSTVGGLSWNVGSLAGTVRGFFGFGRTGCHWRGGIGTGICGTITMLGTRTGYASFGGAIKSGLRIVCIPLLECGGLETISWEPA